MILSGDILSSACEAIVSPVSCDGAQGKGLALAIAQRFLKQCDWYRRHAHAGLAEPGQVYHVLPRDGGDRLSAAQWVLERRRRGGEPLVLFATTKGSWRQPGQLTWIAGCCAGLVESVAELGIESVAICALGCGDGRLPWGDVCPLILGAASQMRARVEVYGPR